MPTAVQLDLSAVASVDLRNNLSAVAIVQDEIWAGGDEGASVVRLRQIPGESLAFKADEPISLEGFLDLPESGEESELDLEGMDWHRGYLWLVGSHSLKRKKPKKNDPIGDLAEVKPDPNRYLLSRVPLTRTEDGWGLPAENTPEVFSAQLEIGRFTNAFLEALKHDAHLARFLVSDIDEAGSFDRIGIPSKDNGLDVEGIAVTDGEPGITRVFVGLRGPVLRGRAVLLEIQCRAEPPLRGAKSGRLQIVPFGEGGPFYRKSFLSLQGLGIRDVVIDRATHGMYILAGPTMDLDWKVAVFLWKQALDVGAGDRFVDEKAVVAVKHDVPEPTEIGHDHAEALALFSTGEESKSMLVLYDSPGKRLDGAILSVDLTRIP